MIGFLRGEGVPHKIKTASFIFPGSFFDHEEKSPPAI
jgi:hypothetical protein